MMLNQMAQDAQFKLPPGPNRSSFCFSCTFDVNIAELWLHWYEAADNDNNDDDDDNGGVFHMHRVGLYVMLERKDEVSHFRNDIRNILDWGIYKNQKDIGEVMIKIKIKEQAELKQREAAQSVVNSTPGKSGASPRKSPTKRGGLSN